MSSKRTDVVQTVKPSPPAKTESPQGDSSHEGQQVENGSDASSLTGQVTAIQRTQRAGAGSAGQLNMANGFGGAHATATPGAAAGGAVLPVAGPQTSRAASTRVSNHPIPTRDPRWAIPLTWNFNWKSLHDPYDQHRGWGWVATSGERDRNEYSENRKDHFDAKRSRS